MDATRAERIGLVNDVHPDREATLAVAREHAARIADNSFHLARPDPARRQRSGKAAPRPSVAQ
jgi:enoyl-CoA hydratase/carnithine racemase